MCTVEVPSKGDSSKNVTFDSDTDMQKLQNRAERYFLQKHYKEALFSVNQAFIALDNTMSNAGKEQPRDNAILLSPPLRILDKQYTFSVSLQTSPPSTSHQLAATGLQSWHELAMKDSKNSAKKQENAALKHLEPMLNHFSSSTEQSTLTPDLFFVWILFWESHGHRKEAFLWTTQILLEGDFKGRERLWLHCVTQQLPKLEDADSAKLILGMISMHRESPPSPEIMETIASLDIADKANAKSVEALQEELEAMDENGLVSLKYLEAAKESLSKMEQELNSNIVVSRLNATRSKTTKTKKPASDQSPQQVVVGSRSGQYSNPSFNVQLNTSQSFYFRWRHTSIYQWGSQSIRDVLALKTSVMRSDDDSMERRQRLQQMALSLALLLLSWRQRKLLVLLGKAAGMMLLAPIREVVDALLIESNGGYARAL